MSQIVIPYFDKLPKRYQEVFNELQIKLNKSFERRPFLKTFAEEYTMLPEMWSFYLKIERREFSYRNRIIRQALTHFPSDFFLDTINHIEYKEVSKCFKWDFLKSLHQRLDLERRDFPNMAIAFEKRDQNILDRLSFPHGKLDDILELYEEFCGPIPDAVIKLVEKQKDIYEDLKEYFANDPEEYWDTVMKIDIAEAQYQNIELLLGSRPYDKSLWEKYFKLLEERNETEKLLGTYRRYCGIFLDDKSIAKKADTLEEQLKAKKPRLEKSSSEEKEPDSIKPLIASFTFKTVIAQSFPFKSPFINYICKNIHGNAMVKLQLTCKQCLRMLPKLNILRLEINTHETEFSKTSLDLSAKDSLCSRLKNLCLTNSLFFEYGCTISQLIEKIVYCNLKFLRLKRQTLTLKEFDFFVQGGNIKFMKFVEVEVVDEQNQKVPLENILSKCPKIEKLHLSPCHITADTFEDLLKTKILPKIPSLTLDKITGLSHVTSCVEFFKTSLAPNACCKLDFVTTEENITGLKTALTKMEKVWKPRNEKPVITVTVSLP